VQPCVNKESEEAVKSYIKSVFNVSLNMKITGQMSEDGALKVGRMFATAALILAGGLALAVILWVIRWW